MKTWRGAIARRAATLLLVAGIVFAVPATLGACDEDQAAAPAGPPDQTGVVLVVTPGSSDVLGTLLVGALASLQEEIVGEASVAVTADTVWVRDGETVEAPRLDAGLLGRRVAVTFTGPVAESFPVQATAGRIELLPTPLGIVGGRTLWAGGPVGTPQPEPNEEVAVHWGAWDGPVVVTITSDAAGRFEVDLRPGRYTLVTVPDDDKMPGSRTVIVEPGQHVTVRLVESVR